ncbi:hypothetical protein QBC44DRAFT_368926 [Cladorrhinum sp. PSN332]|nr:hypothetical protein QBC44DRAFT_368926 [Cladorrhinum sp. PSN332]
MPTTIPYDPQLVLASIVSPAALGHVGAIATAQAPVDATQEELNALLASRRSLDMTKTELLNLGIDTKPIDDEIGNLNTEIGDSVATQMSNAASAQVSDQTRKHSIEGTLVISVSCTHKNASILAPFVLNVDKGIKVWNRLFKDDKIEPTSTSSMLALATGDATHNRFSIISGVTYRSSFVGMVHILNTSSTSVSEKMTSVVPTLQVQMDAGAWYAHASGGFGASPTTPRTSSARRTSAATPPWSAWAPSHPSWPTR